MGEQEMVMQIVVHQCWKWTWDGGQQKVALALAQGQVLWHKYLLGGPLFHELMGSHLERGQRMMMQILRRAARPSGAIWPIEVEEACFGRGGLRWHVLEGNDGPGAAQGLAASEAGHGLEVVDAGAGAGA
eukprot:CAMPEP_0206621256 /NCGR_PEP_ID=MMETSP0325_2-20121206/62113_1 /ASSEMBLY_ACC=CAM_ASM_000347 /TAXON_ID=2866 /ORGANISM="Crypthecodinium cohnii, Strain Seligo" /LENGTH=129 /DNA_ID=CAMNT_0054144377 /DNA_START=81 /DNA_END=472 /DNA_ORIENTATION=+